VCAKNTGLRSLQLRQNILPDASALNAAAFKGALQDLELRDNLLTEVRWSSDEKRRASRLHVTCCERRATCCPAHTVSVY
jgi:hypothetical protein